MTDQSTLAPELATDDRRALRAAAIAMRVFVDDRELSDRLGTAFDLPDEDLVLVVTEGMEHVRPRIEAAFELVRVEARRLFDDYRGALDRLAATSPQAWPMDRGCGDE